MAHLSIIKLFGANLRKVIKAIFLNNQLTLGFIRIGPCFQFHPTFGILFDPSNDQMNRKSRISCRTVGWEVK